MVGNVIVMLFALFNAFIHSRGAWTSVVPTGLVLSALTVLVMLFTGWLGWAMVYHYRIGVAGRCGSSRHGPSTPNLRWR